MDDLNQILSSERTIEPSSGFPDRVMEAIRRGIEAPPALGFPWWRAAAGAATVSLLIGGVIIFLPQHPPPPWLAITGRLLDTGGRILMKAAGPLVAALLISLLSVRLSLRSSG